MRRSALRPLAEAPGRSRLGDRGGRFAGRQPLGARARPRRGQSANPLAALRTARRQLPEEFLADLARSRRLLVVEEHVAHGGVAQILATLLLESGEAPERFATRSAQGYLSGRYGSQKFHRRECGLDSASIVDFLATEDS